LPDWSFGDGCGWTALHHAVFRGDASIVALLLAHGASPFMQDKQGQTPLHIAARQDAQILVEIILKHVSYRHEHYVKITDGRLYVRFTVSSMKHERMLEKFSDV